MKSSSTSLTSSRVTRREEMPFRLKLPVMAAMLLVERRLRRKKESDLYLYKLNLI